MLACEGLSVRFGATRALADVTFRVEPGSLTAIAGPNGSGKSTLLRVATTLERPTSGRVLVGATDVVRDPLAARRQLGWLGQADGLYDDLSVRENLALVARLHGSMPQLADRASEVGIGPKLDERARRLSRGERQRAALARAMLGGPLLLLDEPTTALDAEGASLATDALVRLRGERTIVVATHDADLIKRCDRVVRLDHGRVVGGGA